MSWDFSMAVPVGENGALVDIGRCDANYTYNVSPMFVIAFKRIGPDGIRQIDGMLGRDAAPVLDDALSVMRNEADACRALNPKNGWGDYEGALRLLETLREWCDRFPGAQVRIS